MHMIFFFALLFGTVTSQTLFNISFPSGSNSSFLVQINASPTVPNSCPNAMQFLMNMFVKGFGCKADQSSCAVSFRYAQARLFFSGCAVRSSDFASILGAYKQTSMGPVFAGEVGPFDNAGTLVLSPPFALVYQQSQINAAACIEAGAAAQGSEGCVFDCSACAAGQLWVRPLFPGVCLLSAAALDVFAGKATAEFVVAKQKPSLDASNCTTIKLLHL